MTVRYHGKAALPPGFWEEPATIAVLTSRDVPQLLRLVQLVTGLSQTQIGLAIGKSQGEVSEMMSGARKTISIDVLARIIDGLQMPDAAAATLLLGRRINLPDQRRSSRSDAADQGNELSPTTTSSPSHWAAWYGIRTAHLLTTVDGWNDPSAQPDSLQTLLHQEILMFDALQPADQQLSHTIGRRQVLMTLAALPVALAMPAATAHRASAREAFLARCAASVTACWHLLRGSELNAVEQFLSSYLLGLEALAQQQSPHQIGAAKLASQAHRISGIVALHRSQLAVREHHCNRALHYATMSGDPGTVVAALTSLASTYFYMSDPDRAASIYEQCLIFQARITPLQQARVHAEISVVQAQLGRESEALRSIDTADHLYPKYPDQDPSYLYAEFTRSSLALEQGLAYLALAQTSPGHRYERAAADIFSRQEASAPDRIRLEITNHQARAATLLNDLDAFEDYMTRGVEGIILLGSQQRRRELWNAWQHGLQAWPGESRLSTIRELLPSSPAQ